MNKARRKFAYEGQEVEQLDLVTSVYLDFYGQTADIEFIDDKGVKQITTWHGIGNIHLDGSELCDVVANNEGVRFSLPVGIHALGYRISKTGSLIEITKA